MTPQEWSRIQQGIFEGESGGDYGALFGYQNRPGGKFSNIDLTKMTIDEALEFANPSGNYGQFVKGQVGRVATPMGAYQVVGSTLRDAKKGLGLSGQETMSKDMQDQIGKWIYKTQGTGAWEGYKPLSEDQAIASQTLQVLGKSPKGILAPTQTSETETKPMMQQQKPRGLLERLGVQKMEEGAEGEAGQRFYNRESFGDTLANLAPALGRMGVMGLDVPAQAMANSRREDKLAKAAAAKTEAERNSTGKWLVENGFKDIGEGVLSGAISGTAGLQMSQKATKAVGKTVSAEELRKMYPGVKIENGLYNVKPDNTVSKVGGGGVTVNTGDSSLYGEAPEGTVWVKDAKGEHVMEETAEGSGRFRPATASLAGSNPETREAKLAESKRKNQGIIDGSFDAISLINDIYQDPELKNVTGMIEGRMPGYTQGGTDLIEKIDQLKGKAFLQAFETLKGGGQITEREGLAATKAIARLERKQSPEAYKQSLIDLRSVVERVRKRAQGQDIPEYSDEEFEAILRGGAIAAPTPSASPNGGVNRLVYDKEGNLVTQ